jgi:hypothetical protein
MYGSTHLYEDGKQRAPSTHCLADMSANAAVQPLQAGSGILGLNACVLGGNL